MKVLVCGSRGWTDRWAVGERIARFPRATTFLHGGAVGADAIAGAVVDAMGFRSTVFYADWAKHGRAAGFIRNQQMIETHPDLVLAFWDGVSKGTFHTIALARKRGIPVEIILPE